MSKFVWARSNAALEAKKRGSFFGKNAFNNARLLIVGDGYIGGNDTAIDTSDTLTSDTFASDTFANDANATFTKCNTYVIP